MGAAMCHVFFGTDPSTTEIGHSGIWTTRSSGNHQQVYEKVPTTSSNQDHERVDIGQEIRCSEDIWNPRNWLDNTTFPQEDATGGSPFISRDRGPRSRSSNVISTHNSNSAGATRNSSNFQKISCVEESEATRAIMAGPEDARFAVSIPEDLEKGDLMAATSLLQQKANDVRAQKVNWQSYLQCQMISQEDYNFIVAFDAPNGKAKDQLLEEQKTQCAKTFLNLMGHVSKDQTIYYILVLIDDMLLEDKNRVEIFKEYAKKKKESVWAPFLNMLNRQDGFITNMTSRILAKMACWSRELMDGSDLHFYLTWLKDQLRITENEYIQSVARCLQMMLRIDEYRFAFVAVDGISTLVSVLSGRHNFQIQYQLCFCIWVLTFNPALAEKMNKHTVIPILADILSDSVKEKVTRIVVAVFRNLIEKPEDEQICKEHCIAMVQSKVLKHLDILQQRKFEDEDIQADITFLSDKLMASIVDLSSFDEYATEIKSGRLEWSPVHKSERFWRESAARLCEKNYELLKILIALLESSKDPLSLSVACYDIGEFVRHYPRGKTVIEQLGGKQVVMALLAHPDTNVRYEALLSVQKLMVHNWEYLGKKLEQETQVPAKASA